MVELPVWRQLRATALAKSWALRPWVLRYRAGRPRPGWEARAACAGLPSDVFFDRPEQAIAICETCPVRQDCLFDAFNIESRGQMQFIVGVRGGLGESARQARIRKLRPPDGRGRRKGAAA
jgi:hypothetical protein